VKPEEHAERTIEVAGWPLRVTSYRLGAEWHAKADNVSPGAWFARTTGPTRAEAEDAAVARACERLERTRRLTV
jgi:hypothetical protein